MNYNLKHFAYLGDCVWELMVRKKVIDKTQKTDAMHKLTTKFVCASYQAKAIEEILPLLKEDEIDIQKRARNLKITINKKSNPAMHALATSFEALVGYLYINNPKRLDEIVLPLIEKAL